MNEIGPGKAHSASAETSESESEPAEQKYHIFVANEQHVLAINESLLTQAVLSVLQDSLYQSATISVAVVDDAAIHALNVQFLEHDYPTDVLSFVLEQTAEQLEGELIVSVETADREAELVGWSPHDELVLYVLHGVLHLVGYGDKNGQELQEMLQAEMKYLQQLQIALPQDRSRWQDSGDAIMDAEKQEDSLQ